MEAATDPADCNYGRMWELPREQDGSGVIVYNDDNDTVI